MKKTRKAIASFAIAGMALTMIPFNALAEGSVPTRLAGVTAAQTAVAIADQTGWTGTAILASSASYGMVDALTSGPLATFLKAPVLLQGPENTLNADTKAELTKLNITKVYVASGTAVISQAVINELKGMNITVESLGGFDRFATSANVAQKMVSLGATVKKAAVAYGWLNQDALSIAPIASAQTEPILLTEKDTIPASVKAFLTTNTGVVTTDVIGGSGVISEATKAQLPSATRVYGNTAYDTNVAVLKAFDSLLNYDHVFIANGETAIDALTGAPLAAKYNAGIVLTNGALNEGTAYVRSKQSSSSIATALGGTAVIPESVLVGASYQDSTGGGGSGGGGGGGGGSSSVNNQIASQLISIQGYLNDSELASLRDAKAELLDADNSAAIGDAVSDLLTDELVAKFDTSAVATLSVGSDDTAKAAAKAALKKIFGDLSSIKYSGTKSELNKGLKAFEDDNLPTLKILFGKEMTVKKFFDFLIATKTELPKVVQKEALANTTAFKDLINHGTATEIKNKMVGWTKTAYINVILTNKYKYLDGKLGELGLNTDMIVDAQRQIGAVIDPSNAAEKAVGLAVIRSQIVTKINGTTCTPDASKPVKLNSGDNKPVLSVIGVNTGEINIADQLQLVWTISEQSQLDPAKLITIDSDGTINGDLAEKGDTAEIIASKNGNEIIKFSVKVK